MKQKTLMNVVLILYFGLSSVAYATQDKSEWQQEKILQKNKQHATLKFNNFIYIFLGPGLGPKKHRTVIKTDKFTFTAVGIDMQHKEQVIDVAKEAVANGAQTIELCGGFGPIWTAKVMEALQGKVPVGSVFYGPEARKPMLDLLTLQKEEK